MKRCKDKLQQQYSDAFAGSILTPIKDYKNFMLLCILMRYRFSENSVDLIQFRRSHTA